MEKTWILFYLLWSSALQAKPTNRHTEPDDVKLVGGASRCAGWLVAKRQGEWRAVYGLSDWNMKLSSVVCRQLGCGSAVDTDRSSGSAYRRVWWITASCVGSEASLRECGVTEKSDTSSYKLQVICSESVRLVNGPGLCSGRVEVKSNQSWVSVCEGDFDQQDAEVVCRQLACGAPSVLQGALYGEGKAPMWTKEFQCEGSESNLLDCGTSRSTRNSCSPYETVGLTCSEPDDVRLVGGASTCSGRLEMKHQGEWRPGADDWPFESWSMKPSSVLCRQLGCGSAVYTERRDGSTRQPVWKIRSSCVGSESSLGECGTKGSDNSSYRLEVICADLLFKPILSVSCPMKGVSEGQHQGPWVMEGFNFSMDCSVRPQYPGGSFLLTSTGANATNTYYTQTAVNHSAHFLFPAADHAHRGNYSCVYHVAVFDHDLTSESDFLFLTVKASPLKAFFIRVTVVMLVLWGQFICQYVFWKRRATRGQSAAVENIEMA